MQRDAVRTDTIERDPGAAPGRVEILRGVGFVLRMNPDPRGRMHAGGVELRELLVRGRGHAGVRADGEPGGAMHHGAGPDELALHVVQWTAIEAELDDAGTDLRAVDAMRELTHPARSEHFDGFITHVLRQESTFEGGVVAGGREDVQSTHF